MFIFLKLDKLHKPTKKLDHKYPNCTLTQTSYYRNRIPDLKNCKTGMSLSLRV